MAANVYIGESRLGSLFLLLNPSLKADLSHSLPIGKQSRITLGDAQHSLAGILVAKDTKVKASLAGALSDGTEGWPTPLPASRTGFASASARN